MKQILKIWIKNIGKYGMLFLRWLLLGIVLGLVGGVGGTLFSKSIGFVTSLREQHHWLILLLPVGGIITVTVYKLCKISGVGTNQVFESAREEKSVSPWLAPAVFVCSCLTHLFGGSAGREGAALQLGGGVASLFAKIFRLDEKTRHIAVLCSMGAFFSAIFGTPLGAFVFALEVVCVGQLCAAAIFPALVASVTAFFVAHSLGAEAERFVIEKVPELSLQTFVQVFVLAMVGAFVSVVFCYTIKYTSRFFKKWLVNEYLRTVVGAVLIILLTWAVGTMDYNGGGIDVILRIFETGEVRGEAFALKIIFTAITIAAGFKGGEIVPTLFIGATFGAVFGGLVGLSPAFAAALGMAALFCGVTNCPLATIFLCIEMFGAQGSIYFALAAVVSFLLSGYVSLYSGQKFFFSKWMDELKVID